MLNLKTFQQSLEKLFPDYRQAKFLLAVSGGVDSMVLLDLFESADLHFKVAHINYKLRGRDSDDDRKLVEGICKKNKIPFHLYEVSEKDNQPKNSIQDWARNLRYEFFRKIQEEEKIDFIVTAHHLNDQLETFIINLSKASGIKGLSGIPANDNKILRPLLQYFKEELYAFAKDNNIQFREDLSNQKNDYLRNKIRNEVVPQLLETNKNFLENFGKSISYLNQTKDFVQEQILKIEKETISENDSYLTINKESFFKQSEYIQFEILRKYGFSEEKEIRKIRKAEVGKIFISNEYRLNVDRETLILRKLENEDEEVDVEEIILELNNENELTFPEPIKSKIKNLGSFNWKFDLEKVQLPLKLRPRKEGDILYPIGMIGKKKISKFFKDEKIPILAQQKIWLLCDGNNDVLGILPFRQDRRFAATKESKEIIKVKL
ncbi:tRNA lysidine(34) synthetase TilS [Kaistella sp. G5-32]|uniref:tRNA(Ile)-lysidine synthase n=1 Tax=Kaistella gelatinilytica TaxID=2787636 RepID=A0ABS0FDE3_9FLAO|nr:tRNA lysidine(34) synthetase TilS [Kaistella gelatinilytica]MBF8457687.1 tRNA lysidine(34) synthetase TilS [Kaistella gelatinilytica]